MLDTFIKFGAPEEIGYISKPHLGTDVLCRIVRNIRNYILERGGEIYYSSKMTDMLIADDKVSGVVINGEKEHRCSSLYLAVGHSSRDTFEMLHKKGVVIEQKPISVGVRIEHPVKSSISYAMAINIRTFPALGPQLILLTTPIEKQGGGCIPFACAPEVRS